MSMMFLTITKINLTCLNLYLPNIDIKVFYSSYDKNQYCSKIN